MKLRKYKNMTDFTTHKPFVFPAVKEFGSKSQWAQRKKDTGLLNAEFKKNYNDKFSEKNFNELRH